MSNAEQPIAATDLLGDLDLKLPAGFELIAADPKLGPQILSSLARIEERLAEAIAQTDHLADVASRHLLSAGGKRVRPLLALLSAAVDGEINDEVIEAAVVVELTHLATLYHDDVMDDAPKRRGVDSAQMIWGNSVAILTGDLIFSRASLLVSELGTRPMKIQSQTFERLVLGQLFETTGPREGQDLLDHYIAVIEGKTGSLIAAAGEYGSLLSGASEDVISMVKAYGELVGVAFQLADDVIDIVSDGKTSGKTRGTDLREGVPTLPTTAGPRGSRRRRICYQGSCTAGCRPQLRRGSGDRCGGARRPPGHPGSMADCLRLGGPRDCRDCSVARVYREGCAGVLRSRCGSPRGLKCLTT